MCITGGIQPGFLARCFGREFYENGLVARFLMAMPPRRIKQWSDAEIHADTKAAMEKVFDFPFGLQLPNSQPDELSLTDDAKVAWVEFYNHHAHEQDDLTGTTLAAAWSKLEG